MSQLEQFLETLDEQGVVFETISCQGYYEIQYDNKTKCFSAYTEQELPSSFFNITKLINCEDKK